MKVLIWAQYFWPENFRINAVARALNTGDVNVAVLTGKPNYPTGRIFPGYHILGIVKEKWEGVSVTRIPLIPRGNGSSLNLALNYLSFIASAYLFAPFALRSAEFDCIFVYCTSPLLQALPALYLAKRRGVPCVIWVQDLWPDSLLATGHVRNRFVLRVVGAVVRYIYRKADCILVQSEAFREAVAPFLDGDTKVHYLPNPELVPPPSAAPSAAATDLAARMADTFAIVFAGNLGRVQALDTVLGAAEMLRTHPGITFYLIGDGSLREWLAAEVERRGLSNLVLCPRLPEQDMPTVFAAASALLVSLADSEVGRRTVPSKLQSYLAAGKPVIASLNGEGARILREAGAGLACEAENAAALADVVLTLYRTPIEERKVYGSNALQYFERHFEAKHVLHQLMSHLKSCIDKKS